MSVVVKLFVSATADGADVGAMAAVRSRGLGVGGAAQPKPDSYSVPLLSGC